MSVGVGLVGSSVGRAGAVVRPTGGGYLPEAQALFGRMSTQPDANRKGLINALIKALIDAGVWAKLDALYLMAAHDAQAARRNWIGDSLNLTAVSAPAFTADRGYKGDGSAAWLDAGVMANALTLYKQDDATLALWSLTDLPLGASSPSCDGGHVTGYIGRNGTSSATILRVNTLTGVGTPTGMQYSGYVAWSRTAANVWTAYRNDVAVGGSTNASNPLRADPVGFLRREASAYGTNQLSVGFFGAALSSSQHLAAYNALNTYLKAIGAVP